MSKQLRETSVTTHAPPTATRWTATRYLEWSQPDDGRHYEVLNGELIMAASPIPRHQRIVFRIAKLLDAYVEGNKLGEIYIAPMDVVLGDDLAQPDVFYVSNERRDIVKPERVVGAPDLIVEVLSLSTSQYDLRYKWDLYARSDVREYWVVNPDLETIEVLALINGEYRRHLLAAIDGVATSKLLAELKIPVAPIFAD